MGLRHKSIPAQYATVLQANREQRRPVLAGPVPLVQGGNGFIQRYPVFIKTTEQADAVLLGVVSIVADVDKVLAAGGIKELDIQISIVTENGRLSIWRQNLGLSPITPQDGYPQVVNGCCGRAEEGLAQPYQFGPQNTCCWESSIHSSSAFLLAAASTSAENISRSK